MTTVSLELGSLLALRERGEHTLAGEKPGNTANADLAAWPEAIHILSKLPVSVV
jgi:hypothetical protein